MSIEYQHITGGWKITDYDSRDDPDALPEQLTLKGKVTFRAKFDALDRFEAIRVPGVGSVPSYLLSLRDMVFPVVGGRLQDRQARDGVLLPVVVAGVSVQWTATPELTEDPGRGVTGSPVSANEVTFGPVAPGGDGQRRLNLADVVDTNVEYPEPVVSRVAELVAQAEAFVVEARDLEADTQAAATAAATARGAAEAARGDAIAAKNAAQAHEIAAGAEADTAHLEAAAAAQSATAAGLSATAAATTKGQVDATKGQIDTIKGQIDTARTDTIAAKDAGVVARGETLGFRNQAEQIVADAAAGVVPDGGVTTPKIVNDAVTGPKLAPAVRTSLAKADTASQPGHTHAMEDITGLAEDLGNALAVKEDKVTKGQPGGYAPLDGSGLVPSGNLPSYVDDVLNAPNFASLPGTGVAGKIYITEDNNKTWRWNTPTSTYFEVSPGPGSTDAVAEGAVNKYFTDARAVAALAASLAAKVSVGGQFYDPAIVLLGKDTTRAVGANDYGFGVKLKRATTFTEFSARGASSGGSGNTAIQILKNGSATGMPTVTVGESSAVAGAAATGSWSFAAGDIVSANITSVGTSPGKGLIIETKATA